MTDEVLNLAAISAVRRVATRAGALKFNKAIGQIIGSESATDNSAERSATLQRLLSLYNRMRAAKLYGQEDQFKRASAEMADAIDDYSKKSPGGADKIRSVVEKLSFADEESQRRQAIAAKSRSSK